MTTTYRHPKALDGETYGETCARLCLENGTTPFADSDDAPAELPRGNGAYGHDAAAALAAADSEPCGPGGGGATGTPEPGATEKQRAFLVRLCDERGIGVEERWFATKAAASAAIDDLIAGKYGAPGAAPAVAPVQGATPRQEAFLAKLAEERGLEVDPRWLATRPAASAAIDALLARPKLPSVKTVSDADAKLDADAAYLERGTIHVLGEDVLRVHRSQSSGFPYAVRATIVTPATWVDGEIERPGVVEWALAKGAVYRLTADTVATAAQAAAFGRLAGRCVYCGRAIDTPESTAVGYGPICAGKYGLPWGDTTTPGAQPAPPAT